MAARHFVILGTLQRFWHEPIDAYSAPMAGKSPEADDSTVRVRIDYETRGDRRGYLLLDLHPGWAPWSCDLWVGFDRF